MLRDKTDEMSSNEARDEILSQHRTLRDLLAETTELAERAERDGGDFDALRGRAQALYDALATHMTFEERVLPAALRDVIGWGAVIHQKMEEDHLRQREALALAISAIGPTGLSGAALVENVRAFTGTLVIDMESEERGLLQADLDAIAGDSEGG
jgi:hypothetical protein